MVLKKFVSFVYSFIGLRGHPRIKDAAAAAACRRITVDVSGNVKQGVLESPVGSSSSEIIEAEGEFCCVCLSRLKADEDTSALPCLHRFHKVCIEGWFNNVCRRTCPLCRSSMGGEERSHKREEQFTEEMVEAHKENCLPHKWEKKNSITPLLESNPGLLGLGESQTNGRWTTTELFHVDGCNIVLTTPGTLALLCTNQKSIIV